MKSSIAMRATNTGAAATIALPTVVGFGGARGLTELHSMFHRGLICMQGSQVKSCIAVATALLTGFDKSLCVFLSVNFV